MRKRGRAIFLGNRVGCFSCHAVRDEGGHVGPDLSRIASTRSPEDLLEAVVFPSASFARGYEPYLLTLRIGKTFTGIVMERDEETTRLMTAEQREVRVLAPDVESLEPGQISLMPAGRDRQLTAPELADLLAFLPPLR